MKQITLLPEDFDTLDTKSKRFIRQFQFAQDCPMTRALRRVTGNPIIRNCLDVIHSKSDRGFDIKCAVNFFGATEVKKIAKRVKKNGKAIFRFGIDIKEELNL